MSEYLNIYLVPKHSKDEEPKKPVYLTGYPRSTDEFDAITEEVAVPYSNDKEQYAELTSKAMQYVCEQQENEVKDCEDRIKKRQEALRYITNGEAVETVLCEIDSITKYRDEQQATLNELRHIQWLVERIESENCCDCGEFEKVVMDRG